MRFRTEFVVAVLVLAAGPAGAERTTYCCNDENGRQTCSDVLPPQCYGRAYREINSQGITLRRVEAPLTPEQRVQREQEAKRKREQERLAAEERRQAQALLDAYSSERDIDLVRDRVLKDIEKSLAQAQERYQEAAERHKQLSEEMQFYRKKPAPKELLDAIKENESELRAHGSVVEAKTREMEAVRGKYDEDKRRYIELIRGRSAGVDPRPR